jgi:hypothetical protein
MTVVLLRHKLNQHIWNGLAYPVCKKVLSFAFEQRQLKFFLQTTQQREQFKSADKSLTMEKENHKGLVPETALFSEYVFN